MVRHHLDSPDQVISGALHLIDDQRRRLLGRERNRVAERLRQAAAEGRLLTEELEHRLEASFSARTYGQLNAIVADLPGRHLTAPAEAGKRTWARPALAAVIAVAATLAVIVAVLAVTGVLAMWMLWLFVGWWLTT